MKYISRRIHRPGAKADVHIRRFPKGSSAELSVPYNYGVVDTDTGIEMFMSIEELKGLGQNLAVGEKHPIVGCLGRVSDELSVMPYPLNMNGAQVKLKAMSGIECAVYNSQITSITWGLNVLRKHLKIDKPVQIRLSKIANSCADNILCSVMICGSHKVTLILDDDVSFSEYTFDCWRFLGDDGIGVVFDARQMTNPAMVEILYKSVFANMELCGGDLNLPIKDSQERISIMSSKLGYTNFKLRSWT